MNPAAQAIAQWLAAFANGVLSLDPAARARLSRLDGRTIVLAPDPPAAAVTIRFVGSRIVAETESPPKPSVVVSGPAPALLEALVRGRFGDALEIEGDELTLAEFADAIRALRPDLATPLERLVGRQAAESVVGLLELGFETAGRVLRDMGAEGERFARTGAARQYLARPQFDEFLSRRHAAALHLDRIVARLERLESGPREPT